MIGKIYSGIFLLLSVGLILILLPGKAGKIPESVIPFTSPDTTPIAKCIRNFDAFLGSNLDSSQTIGAATVIVKGDSVIYLRTFGVRRAGSAEPVTPNTVFRLASVSKGFAGVLALQLQKEGSIDLDDPVRHHLPGLVLRDSISTADLSIHHLLNHTSGLVPHAYDNLVEAGLEIRDIIPELARVDISAPPGEIYGYQNVMFSLLDTIASQVTGKEYASLLREKLFGPLGMENTSAGFSRLVWNPDVAFPHVRRTGMYRALPMHTGYYNVLPAAGINASISDMGIWLRALLGNAPDVLDDEILSVIYTPQIVTPLKRQYTRQWDEIDGRYYSHGWRIFDYKGRRIIYHGGYVRGYRAEAAFCPSEQVGISFLQNSPNMLAAQCIPTFFDLLFATEPSPGSP